ncbi:nuclear transport factor 2 family protein [Zavarzinia sp.]|uniref:nuclear transport factor 2 family protein n=1 Tax=Zavarzinia sp. TaxID=2027920 RepID=UPI003BB7BEF0|nr:nuclear transport factor 2 family protein [Zavarzinia sp.]
MRYESPLDAAALEDLAIRRYFAAVDAKDIEGVLSCLHDEALFTVQTDFVCHAGKPAIRRMLRDYFAAFETIVHRNFQLCADPATGRVAASFEGVVTTADGNATHLYNTNIWRVRDTRFQEIHVFMSGPNVLV